LGGPHCFLNGGNLMRTAFAVSLAIAVIVSGACSDRTSGPLGSRLASDTTKDSTGSLTIAPAVDTIAMGDSARFTATTADSQPVSWTVSDSTVARIEAGGTGSSVLLRAVATGATAITATSGGRSGSARLVVTDGVPVAS